MRLQASLCCFTIRIGVLLEVRHVGYEPHDVIHAAANRSERGLDILKHLLRLGAKPLRAFPLASTPVWQQRGDDADR